jgi:hypothetical protein
MSQLCRFCGRSRRSWARELDRFILKVLVVIRSISSGGFAAVATPPASWDGDKPDLRDVVAEIVV